MITVQTNERGDGCLVSVDGELTIERAAEFRTILHSALENGSSTVVDLGRVSRADLTCLQILCSACLTSYLKKTPITISGLSGGVIQAAENSGLTLFPDSGDARCWISGGYHG